MTVLLTRKTIFTLWFIMSLVLTGSVVEGGELENLQEDIRSFIQEGSYDLALRRLSGDQASADSFSHQFQKAYCLQELDRWEEAALLFEKLLPVSSSLEEYVRLFLAICYDRLDQHQKAEEQLTKLLQEEDHLLVNEARELLAHIYMKSSRANEAIQIFQLLLQASDLKDRRAELLLFAARAHGQVDRGEEAALLLGRIISQYPATQTAIVALEELTSLRGKPLVGEELFHAAEVLFGHGRYGEAAEQWSRYVQLYPHHRQASEALYLSARASYHDKRYSQAMATCQRLLKTYPHSQRITSVHYLQARCVEAEGKTSQAMERYHQFVRHFPWSQLADDALWRAARFSERRGDFAGAQREYLALSREYASRRRAPEALWRAGLWAFFRGDEKTAIDLFGRLRIRYPESHWTTGAQYWEARAHLRGGQAATATRLLNQVVRGDSAGYYGLRARERLGETDPQLAMRDSSNSGLHLPKGLAEGSQPDEDVVRHLQRGKTLLRLGLLARARVELSRVHRVAHQHAHILMGLLQFYQQLQLPGDALRLAQQAGLYLDKPLWKDGLEPFLYPLGYMGTVVGEAEKYGLDPHFLAAVIRAESLFDPLAVSSAGAVGLMQIMPSTAEEIKRQLELPSNSRSSAFRPDVNIRLGSYYLWRQLQAFEGRPEMALAAYNAGPGNVRRWLRQLGTVEPELFVELIEFAETRGFIKKVLTTEALYGRIWSVRG